MQRIARNAHSTRMGNPASETVRTPPYRDVLWHILARQIVMYFLPLFLLGVFFNVQYGSLTKRTLHAHLSVMAEHQASTMDLFLRERLVNLANLIDDPVCRASFDSQTFLTDALTRLRQVSEAFEDIGFVDESGSLVAYHGPANFGDEVSYQGEVWFDELNQDGVDSVITDIYLGLRGRPHFTIAVRRQWGGAEWIIRAALSPESIQTYLTSLEGANEVRAALVNPSGVFQIAPAEERILEQSRYQPPPEPHRGFVDDEGLVYGYAWLSEIPWVLIVSPAGQTDSGAFIGMPHHMLFVTVSIFLLVGVVMVISARKLAVGRVRAEQQKEELSGQLVQAAKLASVGELAAGIAHEINNPLAIIAEEVGLLKDSLDPELQDDDEEININESLDNIHEAVFRCRDITRKLLTFVRQSDVQLEPHNIHDILDEVVDGMLGTNLSLANVGVSKNYDDTISEMVTDRNRLIQVFVNLIKNAMDAMPTGGELMLETEHRGAGVSVRIIDTGSGMTETQMKRIFQPFFTTKEPGKGTGLGLSVCLGIVEGLGGWISAESVPEKGSTFHIDLPYDVNG